MSSTDFPRDRYDPERLTALFESAEVIDSGDIYAVFEYEGVQIEVHYPEAESTSVSESLRQTALNACRNIRTIDNHVQADCEKEAKSSEHDVTNFKLSIAYLTIYIDRIAVRYWGDHVNTEWDAEFRWDDTAKEWTPVNFADFEDK